MQTGGMVPGSGHGDIVPAMLEPGEAIIPRYLVPLIAPILAAHRVPGFGGVPQSSASHFAAGGVVPAGGSAGGVSAADLAKIAKEFAFTLTGAIASEVKNAAGAKNIAQALVNKIGQEVGLAKNVASAAMAGQGYGNAGLIGGMDPSGGSVQQQMQDYLGHVRDFTKDIAKLRKGHLNKDIISQLVAAGPVQGDLLAQSILGAGTTSGSGIGQVNKLWGQLGGATKGLGAQAAMAQYGGVLAPNLKSGTFANTNVQISINAGGGATLVLSDAQIKAVVAKVQAALLKQAKRNNKTGLQLPSKGA